MQYVNGTYVAEQIEQEASLLAKSPLIKWDKVYPVTEQSDFNFTVSVLSGGGFDANGFQVSKGEAIFDCAPEVIFDYVMTPEYEGVQVFQNVSVEILEEYDARNHVILLNWITPVMPDGRICLLRTSKVDLLKKEFVVAFQSVTHSHALSYPITSSLEMAPSGWFISGTEDGRSKITFLQQFRMADMELEHEVLGHVPLKAKTEFLESGGQLGRTFLDMKLFIDSIKNPKSHALTRIALYTEGDLLAWSRRVRWESDWKRVYFRTDYSYDAIYKTEHDGSACMATRCSWFVPLSPQKVAEAVKDVYYWTQFKDDPETGIHGPGKGTVVEVISDSVVIFYVDYEDGHDSVLLFTYHNDFDNFCSWTWRSITHEKCPPREGVFRLSFLPSGMLIYPHSGSSFITFTMIIENFLKVSPEEQNLPPEQREKFLRTALFFGVKCLGAANFIRKNLSFIAQNQKTIQDKSSLGSTPSLPSFPVAPTHSGILSQNFSPPIPFSKESGTEQTPENENETSNTDNRRRKGSSVPLPSSVSPRPTLHHIGSSTLSFQYPKIQRKEYNKTKPFLFLVSGTDSKKSGKSRKLTCSSFSLSYSIFDSLPEEIIMMILFMLDADDLLRCSLVCKRLKMTADSRVLWKDLYFRDWGVVRGLAEKKYNIGIQNSYAESLNNNSNNNNNSSGVGGNTALRRSFGNVITDPLKPSPHISLKLSTSPPPILPMLANLHLSALPSDVTPPSSPHSYSYDQTPTGSSPSLTPRSSDVENYMNFESTFPIVTPTDTPIHNTPPTIPIDSTKNKSYSDLFKDMYVSHASVDRNWRIQRSRRVHLPSSYTSSVQAILLHYPYWKEGLRSMCSNSNSGNHSCSNNCCVDVIKISDSETTQTNEDGENDSVVAAVITGGKSFVSTWLADRGTFLSCLPSVNSKVVSLNYVSNNTTTTNGEGHSRASLESKIRGWANEDCLRVGYHNGMVQEIDTLKRKVKWEQRLVLLADGFIFSPPKFVVWDHTCQVWDEESRVRLHNFDGHSKKVTSAKADENIKRVWTSSADRTVKVWSCENGECVATLNGHKSSVNCVERLTEHLIITGSNDKTMKLWDMRSLSDGNLISPCIVLPALHTGPIRSIKYVESAQKFCSGSDDQTIGVWDAPHFIRGKGDLNRIGQGGYYHRHGLVTRLYGSSSAVTCLDFNEERLVMGSADGSLVFWDFGE